MADDFTPPDPNAIAPSSYVVPSQLPVPSAQDSLTGDNWARNLMVLGGQMASANNARFGAGFLQNPGTSGIPVGLGNAVGQISNLDSQAAGTQNTLAEAENKRLANTMQRFSNDYYLAHPDMLFNPLGNNKSLTNVSGSLTGDNVPPTPGDNVPATRTPVATPVGNTGATSATPFIIPPERRQAMIDKATVGQGIPAEVAPVLMGAVQQESGWDANAVNRTSGAQGLGQVLASTAAQPGYGVPATDMKTLQDPQAQLNFAARYLYNRAKTQLGMTDADWTNNPGMISHALALYGGAATNASKAAYVGAVASHMLPPQQGPMPNGSSVGGISPQALAQAGGAPQAANPTDAALARPEIQQAAAAAAGTPAPGFDPNGKPLPAGAWDAAPAHAQPQPAPNAATAPPQAPVAAPGSLMAQRQGAMPDGSVGPSVGAIPAKTGPVPITPSPGIAPGAPATVQEQRAVQGQPAVTGNPAQPQNTNSPLGLPPNIAATHDRLVARADALNQQAAALHQQSAALARFQPAISAAVEQQATSLQTRAIEAQTQADKLVTDFQTEQSKIQQSRPGGTQFNPATGITTQPPIPVAFLGKDGNEYSANVQHQFGSNGQVIGGPLGPNGEPYGTVGEATMTKINDATSASQKQAMESITSPEAANKFQSMQTLKMQMQEIDQSLDIVNKTPGYYNTGAGASVKLEAAKVLNGVVSTFGGQPIANAELIAHSENAVKLTTRAAWSSLSSSFGAAREAASTIQNATSANPSIEGTPAGDKLMVNGILEGANYATDLHIYQQQWIADGAANPAMGIPKHNPNDARASAIMFMQNHPPQPYIDRANSQIKPIVYDDAADAESAVKSGKLLPGTMVAFKGAAQDANGNYLNAHPVPGTRGLQFGAQ